MVDETPVKEYMCIMEYNTLNTFGVHTWKPVVISKPPSILTPHPNRIFPY